MMFAIITPALITGAFANRVTLQGVPALPHRVADPRLLPVRAHDLGRRALAQWGVLDFAGGIVVHAIAGFAALASVLYVGTPPRVEERAAQRSR